MGSPLDGVQESSEPPLDGREERMTGMASGDGVAAAARRASLASAAAMRLATGGRRVGPPRPRGASGRMAALEQ